MEMPNKLQRLALHRRELDNLSGLLALRCHSRRGNAK